MSRYILDSNALYRYFRDQPGADQVRKLLDDAFAADERLEMSAVNWGEVYYTIARQTGYREADNISRKLESIPLKIVGSDQAQAEFAGRIKAGYGLHYADCFAAALAGKTGTVVTADVMDFKKVPWLKTMALPPAKQS